MQSQGPQNKKVPAEFRGRRDYGRTLPAVDAGAERCSVTGHEAEAHEPRHVCSLQAVERARTQALS